MSEVVEIIRKFVEDECKKPTSKYGYGPYLEHFVPMVKYSEILAQKLNADLEIVELSAWLHDIGSIIYGREDHHITSCEIAERKLKELNYPQEKINKIKHCILTHRGSRTIPRETVEAQIIADADAMSAFDCIWGLFEAAYVFEKKERKEAKKSVQQKLKNSWNKISPDAKDIVRPKYEALKLLFGGWDDG